MRAVVLVVLAAGCGRFGFDESSTTPPDDATAPAIPNICNSRVIGDLGIASEATVKLRATALSSGYAVAVQTEFDNTYMARLDANGAVVATTLPFGGGYQLHGISQVADRPFVYVFTAGAGYIKLLVPDWSAYDTGPSGELFSMDPQQALLPNSSKAIYGVFTGGVLDIHQIDADNGVTGSADYSPPATFASFGTVTSGVRVVVANAGTCETFTIASDGTTGARHQFSPCSEPRLATLGDEGTVLYQTTANQLAIHQIPAVATDAGVTQVIEDGTNPRIATIDGAIWVAYLRTTGEARLVRIAGEAVTMRDYPEITSAFDLIPTGAFWVTAAGELHAGAPCL